MKKILLAFFFCCTLTLPIGAADWYWAGQDTAANQIFIDNGSVEKNWTNGMAVFWIKINSTNGYSMVMQLAMSRNRMIVPLYMVIYGANGNMLLNRRAPNPTPSPVIPGTPLEAIYKLVWGNQPYTSPSSNTSSYNPYKNPNHPDWYPSGATI